MKIVRYANQYRDAWNQFNRIAKNGSFQFDRNYMEYHSHRFSDHSLLFFDHRDALLAIFPANADDGVLYSHQGLSFGGVVAGYAMRAELMLNLFDALDDYMRTQSFRSLYYKAIPYIYHRYPAQEDLYALFLRNAAVIRMDVTSSLPYANRQPFSENKKRGVKKANRAGIKVVESQNYKAYMALLTEALKQRHDSTPTHTAVEISLLQSLFPENIKLYVALGGEEIVAGVVVFLHDNVVHLQYILNTDQGMRDCALDLVVEHVIDVHQQSGRPYFDFGISNEQQGQVLNRGLIGQKERFGARAVAHMFFQYDL